MAANYFGRNYGFRHFGLSVRPLRNFSFFILHFSLLFACLHANAAPSYWAAIETSECDYAKASGADDIANYSMYYCPVASAAELFKGSSVDAIGTYIENNFASAKSMATIFDSVAFSDDEYHILDYVTTAFDTSDYVAFAIYGDDAYRVYGAGIAALTPYGSLVFNESSATAGSVGDWEKVETTPEPTSGLLLLIGLAGIALKRKRQHAAIYHAASRSPLIIHAD